MQTFHTFGTSPHRLFLCNFTSLKENIQAEGTVWVKARSAHGVLGVLTWLLKVGPEHGGEARGK